MNFFLLTSACVVFVAVLQVESLNVVPTPEKLAMVQAMYAACGGGSLKLSELLQEVESESLLFNHTPSGRMYICLAGKAGLLDHSGAPSLAKILPLLQQDLKENLGFLQSSCFPDSVATDYDLSKVLRQYEKCLLAMVSVMSLAVHPRY